MVLTVDVVDDEGGSGLVAFGVLFDGEIAVWVDVGGEDEPALVVKP